MCEHCSGCCNVLVLSTPGTISSYITMVVWVMDHHYARLLGSSGWWRRRDGGATPPASSWVTTSHAAASPRGKSVTWWCSPARVPPVARCSHSSARCWLPGCSQIQYQSRKDKVRPAERGNPSAQPPAGWSLPRCTLRDTTHRVFALHAAGDALHVAESPFRRLIFTGMSPDAARNRQPHRGADGTAARKIGLPGEVAASTRQSEWGLPLPQHLRSSRRWVLSSSENNVTQRKAFIYENFTPSAAHHIIVTSGLSSIAMPRAQFKMPVPLASNRGRHIVRISRGTQICIRNFPALNIFSTLYFLSLTTLTEVFPCFFLSCKANARVKLTNRGTVRTLQK